MTDKRHNISETKDKITVKTDLKRGSGTRDQDKTTIKTKGSDPEDIAERHTQTLKELQERMPDIRMVEE